MVCPVVKIDSNITGLSIAEEECLKVLPDLVPDSGAQDGAVWYGQEPNNYTDFGSTISTVARQPIDPSRQNKKGTVTTVDANGGFNTDVTKNNILRQMQGFMFADAREKFSTLPLNAAQVAINSVAASSKTYAATTGLLALNVPGSLILAEDFGMISNNGLKTVVSATASGVVVSETLADEALPPQFARLTKVGHQFVAGDVVGTVVGGRLILTATAGTFNTFDLTLGEWVYLGGDASSTRLGANFGYARISSIAAKTLSFDDTTFTPVAAAGSGISLRIFFGTVIRNEKLPSLIKRRTYQLERTLGTTSDGDVQAEYLIGAVSNQFTLNIPNSDKLTADFAFIALDSDYRNGSVADPLKLGTHMAAMGEAAINTSSDLFRFKVAIHSAGSNPEGLFGFASDGSIAIDNGATPLKALANLGAIDTATGNFNVTGSVTAYFQTVEAVKAVRENADVGVSAIFAADNSGQIFDIPLVGLGNGRPQVELNQPIMLPLDMNGAECANGYTMLYNHFAYLPDVAMPDV